MDPCFSPSFLWSVIYMHDESAGAIGTRYDAIGMRRIMSTKTSILNLLDL